MPTQPEWPQRLNTKMSLTSCHSIGGTLLTASRKSFSVTVFLRARMANMPASVHTLLMSAPVELGHSLRARSS